MPEVLFCALIVIIFIAAIIINLAVYIYVEDHNLAKWPKTFTPIVSVAVVVSLIVWIVLASNLPDKAISESYHEIQDVNWLDGTKTQIFLCDGEVKNLTAIQSRFFDAKEFHVKKTKWEKYYYGISFVNKPKEFSVEKK